MNDDTISRQAAIRFIRDKVSLSLFMKRSVDKADKACMELCDMLDRELPSAQPEIIYCKDCVKHNKGHGYYLDGTVIGIKDCCPLVEIRGIAQGHEFDYQYCAYAERRTDG